MQERARKGVSGCFYSRVEINFCLQLLSEEEKKKLELEEGEHRQVTDGCIVA